MKTIQSKELLSIQLSSHELWYLAKLFAPGVIFGVADPTEGMDDAALTAFETAAYTALNQAGVLQFEDGKRLRVDEMLGAMVYSTMHSADMLAVKQEGSHADVRYYHFLPDWQLEMQQMGEAYQLTLLKERSQVFEAVLHGQKALTGAKAAGGRFSVSKRTLELAQFLFESGKQAQAQAALAQDLAGDAPDLQAFLGALAAADIHLVFEMVYQRQDALMVHQRGGGLLQTNDRLYWLEDDVAGEDSIEIIHFIAVDAAGARERFNRMIGNE